MNTRISLFMKICFIIISRFGITMDERKMDLSAIE